MDFEKTRKKPPGKIQPGKRVAGSFPLNPFDADDFEWLGKKIGATIQPSEQGALQEAGRQYFMNQGLTDGVVFHRDSKATIKALKRHAEPLLELLQELDSTTVDKLISAAKTRDQLPLTELLTDPHGLRPLSALVASISEWETHPAPPGGRPTKRPALEDFCHALKSIYSAITGNPPTVSPRTVFRPPSPFCQFADLTVQLLLSGDGYDDLGLTEEIIVHACR